MLQTLMGYPALQAGIAMAPRGIGSFLFMPITGIIMSKYDARKILIFGVIVSAWSLVWLADINLSAGYWDIFWPQFVQGVGMAFVFVPLTTITMDPIPKERMGNATSLFNVMRNIGGSVGIATASTLLARRQQVHTNIMTAHITPYGTAAQSMLERLQAGFVSAGSDPVTATQRAHAALFGMVQQQAAMMSFIEIFWWFGLAFFAVLPLIFLMRRPATKGGGMAAH
jgi:DHA2 family multidrug resistance protein